MSVLLVVSLWAYRGKRKANQQLLRQKLLIEKREKEKGWLLRELHHRVKNNLQLVSSILNLQAYQLKDQTAAMAIQESQSRVQAMALIHRDLYLKDDTSRVNLQDYVVKMLNGLMLAHGYYKDQVQLDLSLPPLKVEADIAIPFGLILNELLSNVFKHAFPGNKRPSLQIRIERDTGHELLLQIKDNGPGIAPGKTNSLSFGREMMETLAKQLGATLSSTNNRGCETTLSIPKKLPSESEPIREEHV
nr:sensor histidine kinase [Xanthovirga aplysinae]